jgi:putative nucleotidyltransferase with HDIG domain
MLAGETPAGAAETQGTSNGSPPAVEVSDLALGDLLVAAERAAKPTGAAEQPAEVAAGALEAALRTKAPQVHATTPLVRRLARALGQRFGLAPAALMELELAAALRDVGMIAIPDTLVNSDRPLAAEDWELLHRHPVVGAEIVAQIPVLTALSDPIRFHHERWDGQGYPDGLAGEAIPLSSRLIAASDAFVAIAQDRPHRRGLGAEVALEQVIQASGSQLDPAVVDLLVAIVAGVDHPRPSAQRPGRRARAAKQAAARANHGAQSDARWIDVKAALEELDVVPALAPAHERLLDLADADDTTGGDLVGAVEDDAGLTVAVLRYAQDDARRRRITNISDAVGKLGVSGVREAVEDLPLSEFPWRSSPWAILLQRFRVHALAVSRAAVRISGEADVGARDDVLVAALLHDVGKLVLSRARQAYPAETQVRETPEERVRHERRAFGVDHAALGALLLRRWGLPDALATTVADHHIDEGQTGAALVRLADMLVHHAQGGAVDRSTMLSLGSACGLHPRMLREVLFELPRVGGSRRRRAQPSPLSRRQTEALRGLADGMVYAAIAEKMGITATTVRTHLHGVYSKLGVPDRAQAVLLATEQGWI